MAQTLAKFAGVPAGGTDNQVLTKTSGADYAVAWETPSGGTNGNLWFVQSLVDANAVSAGDLLLQTTTGDVYQASAPGTGNWGTPVMNLKGPQGDPGEGGATAINDLGDAADNGSVNLGSYVWEIKSGVKVFVTFVEISGSTYVDMAPDNVTIGKASGGYAVFTAQYINLGSGSSEIKIGTATDSVGFYGVAGTVIQVVPDGTMDGAIAALTFSDPPTQAECEALRDACETLRDEITALRQALYNLNLISPI